MTQMMGVPRLPLHGLRLSKRQGDTLSLHPCAHVPLQMGRVRIVVYYCSFFGAGDALRAFPEDIKVKINANTKIREKAMGFCVTIGILRRASVIMLS